MENNFVTKQALQERMKKYTELCIKRKRMTADELEKLYNRLCYQSPNVFVEWREIHLDHGGDHTMLLRSNKSTILFQCIIKSLVELVAEGFLIKKPKQQINLFKGIMEMLENTDTLTHMNSLAFNTFANLISWALNELQEKKALKEEKEAQEKRIAQQKKIAQKKIAQQKEEAQEKKIAKQKKEEEEIREKKQFIKNVHDFQAYLNDNKQYPIICKALTELDVETLQMKIIMDIFENCLYDHMFREITKQSEKNIFEMFKQYDRSLEYFKHNTRTDYALNYKRDVIQVRTDKIKIKFWENKSITYIKDKIKIHKTTDEDEDPCSNTNLKPHQLQVKTLLSRESPVCRLLVNHRVGAGKTRTAIEVLNNYFEDPRTKIVICPSDVLCQQFLEELLEKNNNKYKSHLKNQGGNDPRKNYETGLRCTKEGACLSYYKQEDCRNYPNHIIQFTPASAQFRKYMPGPLLIIPIYKVEYILEQKDIASSSYNINSLCMTSLFRRGMINKNPMSGKIIIFDEFHTLFTPTVHTRILLDKTRIRQNVSYTLLKKYLTTMQGSLLAAFTATPPSMKHVENMVPVLTGCATKTKIEDLNGHVHCYIGNDAIFPNVDPISEIKQSVIINNNDLDTSICQSKFTTTTMYTDMESYTNITCPVSEIKIESVRNKILNNLPKYAPKISSMLTELEVHKKEGKNILILTSANTGIDLLEVYFKQKNYKYIRISETQSRVFENGSIKKFKLYGKAIKKWDTECTKKMKDNPIQIIMIETTKLAEGLNIRGVSVILGLSSYRNVEEIEQAFGRADRMCTKTKFRDEHRPTNKLVRKHYVVSNVVDKPFEEWKNMESYKQEYQKISF